MATSNRPIVPHLPEAPVRADARPDFSIRADNFVAALDPWGQKVDQLGSWMNGIGGLIQQYLEDAEQWHSDTKDEADRAENEADRSRDEADRARQEVENAKDEVANAQAEVDRAADEADRSKQYKDEAAALLALTGGEVNLPEFTDPRAPLIANEDLTSVRFDKRALNSGVNAKPSLRLDFINQKQLDPRVTFKRASKAWYFGEDGTLKEAGVDEPRFVYDPATGVANGLLLEPKSTNLVRRSGDLDYGWNKTRCTVQKMEEGSKIISNTTENSCYTSHAIENLKSGVNYCLTAKVDYKSIPDGLWVQVALHRFSFGLDYSVRINNKGVVELSSNNNPTFWDYLLLDEGHAELYIAAESIETQITQTTILIYLITPNSKLEVGDSAVVNYVQLEESASPTSFIPTDGSEVTRLADDASYEGAFSGSHFIHFTYLGGDERAAILGSDSNSQNIIINGDPGIGLDFRGLGVTDVIYPSPNFRMEVGENYKMAVGITKNQQRLFIDGQEILNLNNSLTSEINNLRTIRLLRRNNGANLRGEVKQYIYYPRKLSDTELKELTS